MCIDTAAVDAYTLAATLQFFIISPQVRSTIYFITVHNGSFLTYGLRCLFINLFPQYSPKISNVPYSLHVQNGMQNTITSPTHTCGRPSEELEHSNDLNKAVFVSSKTIHKHTCCGALMD